MIEMIQETNLVIKKSHKNNTYTLQLGDDRNNSKIAQHSNFLVDFFAKIDNKTLLDPIAVSEPLLKLLDQAAASEIEIFKKNYEKTDDQYILIKIEEIYIKAQKLLAAESITLEFSSGLNVALRLAKISIQNKQAIKDSLQIQDSEEQNIAPLITKASQGTNRVWNDQLAALVKNCDTNQKNEIKEKLSDILRHFTGENNELPKDALEILQQHNTWWRQFLGRICKWICENIYAIENGNVQNWVQCYKFSQLESKPNLDKPNLIKN